MYYLRQSSNLGRLTLESTFLAARFCFLSFIHLYTIISILAQSIEHLYLILKIDIMVSVDAAFKYLSYQQGCQYNQDLMCLL